MWWLVLACADPPELTGTDLPTHSECLAEGEAMTAETCLAVVEADARMPTVSYRSVDAAPPVEDDPRATDPDYEWLATEIQRCTCGCCHTASYGGPGVFRYDLEFGPVWIDSASSWTLKVLVGDTGDALRTLPTTDPGRLRALIEREWALREGE